MIFNKTYIEEVLSEKIKEEWKRTNNASGDSFFGLPESSLEEKRINEARVSENIEKMRVQMDAFSSPIRNPFWNRKHWKRKTERMFDEILWGEELLGIENVMSKDGLDGFKEETKTFVRKVRSFDSELQLEDMGQAIRNYIVYAIFRELNGLPQICTEAIFGYSMLYPYTDNYIDDKNRTKEEKKHYNKLIEDKLKGNTYEVLSRHEEKTVQLLSAIEGDYERPNDIYEGLLLMLEAQRNSQYQPESTTPLTEEEIIDISVYKGGLSVLIDRYFVNKSLTENDLFFYYGFGFLLQLCDDLQDITEDKENGSRTLFSVCKTPEETQHVINRLLLYAENLFKRCDCKKEEFKEFLLRNCYMLILFSAAGSREHLAEEWIMWAEGRMPVSIEYIDRLKSSFILPEGESKRRNGKYMKMMDTLLKDG